MAQTMLEKKMQLAEESPKTKKAREKLKKQLEALDRKITPQALQKKTIEIHRWIERHAQHRVVLKNKSICLFDENQNTAALSQRVVQLADKLKKEASRPSKMQSAENFYSERKTTIQA